MTTYSTVFDRLVQQKSIKFGLTTHTSYRRYNLEVDFIGLAYGVNK